MKKYLLQLLALIVVMAVGCKKEKAPENPIQIGKFYQGGYIFSIDSVARTGLAMAPSETERPLPWGCTGTLVDIGGNPTDAIGWGLYCTSRMVYKCNEMNSAGQYCYNLSSGGYSDWYLPSLSELNTMLQKLIDISDAKLKPGIEYWAAFEADANRGTSCKSTEPGRGTFYSKSILKEIRAVRTFNY